MTDLVKLLDWLEDCESRTKAGWCNEYTCPLVDDDLPRSLRIIRGVMDECESILNRTRGFDKADVERTAAVKQIIEAAIIAAAP